MIESAGNLGAYRSDFLMNFCVPREYGENMSKLALHIPDTAGHFDSFDEESKNEGFKQRQKMFEFSNSQTFYFPILFDFSQSERLIFPGNDISITFYHNSDEHRLCSSVAGIQFLLDVEDVELIVTKYWLTSSMVDNAYNELSRNTYQPFFSKRLSVQGPFGVTKGSSHLSVTVCSNMRKPLCMFAAFVNSEGFSGTFTKNPFYYESIPITFTIAKFGSEASPSMTGYKPHYSTALANPQLTVEYGKFVQAITGSTLPSSSTISFDTWLKGQHFYSYPFSTHSIANNYLQSESEPRDNLSLEFQFSEPIKNNYVLLVYVITQSLVKYHSSNIWSVQNVPGSCQ